MGEGGAEPPTKLLKGGLGKISIFKGVLGKSGLTFCNGGGGGLLQGGGGGVAVFT